MYQLLWTPQILKRHPQCQASSLPLSDGWLLPRISPYLHQIRLFVWKCHFSLFEEAGLHAIVGQSAVCQYEYISRAGSWTHF